MTSRLKGKVAVVTGAGSGIGRGCALMFAKEGAIVIGVDINEKSARETAEQARAAHQGVQMEAPIDVNDEKAVEALFNRVASSHHGIDILVTAAHRVEFESVPKMSVDQWRNTMVGELDIVFLPVRAAWPHMVQRGAGSIINFASVAAWAGVKLLPQIAHAAGKGGVLAMTRQLALEGAPHGIRANSISPGLVVTPATKGAFDNLPGFEVSIRSKTLLNRFGTPDDIAFAATYLASDEASWVTGADLRVDGGATAW